MKEIRLVHPFLWKCLDFNALLQDCNKLNTFCGRLEKQAIKSLDADKYKGDGLEILVEALVKLSPIDKRIGIYDYEPVLDNDTGVDGCGLGLDGTPATVQIKYRKADWILTANADHLSNFPNASFMKFGVNPNSEDNMLIVTTAKELHHHTHEEMFCGKVRTINRELLRQLLDENNTFWRLFLELWQSEKDKNLEDSP